MVVASSDCPLAWGGRGGGVQAPMDCQPACVEGGGGAGGHHGLCLRLYTPSP